MLTEQQFIELMIEQKQQTEQMIKINQRLIHIHILLERDEE